MKQPIRAVTVLFGGDPYPIPVVVGGHHRERGWESAPNPPRVSRAVARNLQSLGYTVLRLARNGEQHEITITDLLQ